MERYKRWMLFVDGENITARGQVVADRAGITLTEGRWHKRDVFLWIPHRPARETVPQLTRGLVLGLREDAVRAFYYASCPGDRDAVLAARKALWDMDFSAEVFPSVRNRKKSKGVDIALTKDMLANAFLDNYDVAVIASGDADYLPVINEVKRLGKQVCVVAFDGDGAEISPDLRLSADWFIDFRFVFLTLWRNEGTDSKRQ